MKTGLDGEALARTSRLTARVDNNAVADGFQLYLHSFVITKSGEWAVVQQGMSLENHSARRYHWHSATVRDFVSDPHTAILGRPQGEILNLVDARATKAQHALLTIAKEPVEVSLSEARKLTMPTHHALEEEFALASALIEARGNADMTQEEVAAAMGTTQAVVARLESGKVLPSTRTLERFAKATRTRLRISFEPAPETAR
jgi:hypothetical protein